jgi:hypothetical protein
MTITIRTTICPRYWGRLWRYRWIVSATRLGLIADGRAWTRRGAQQAADQIARELDHLGDRAA